MDQMTQQHVLDALLAKAEQAGVFERVELTQGLGLCHAKDVEEEAWYQVGPIEAVAGETAVWVGMHTPDRWLSESIEADVLHMGDKFEDLLEEELIDQGLDERLEVQHFRDDAKVFVFRSAVVPRAGQLVDGAEALERAFQVLLSYEACFRELGDMTPDEG